MKKGYMFLISLFLALFLVIVYGRQDKVLSWVYGIYLDQNNATFILESPITVSNDTDNVAGIFVENDTISSIDITIDAHLSAEFNNATGSGIAAGIYFNGTFSFY